MRHFTTHYNKTVDFEVFCSKFIEYTCTNNYFNTKQFGKNFEKIKWCCIFALKYTTNYYKQMLLAKHGASGT